MALIKCPECEKEISDKTKACIHCGYPIENKAEKTIAPISEEKTIVIYFCCNCRILHEVKYQERKEIQNCPNCGSVMEWEVYVINNATGKLEKIHPELTPIDEKRTFLTYFCNSCMCPHEVKYQERKTTQYCSSCGSIMELWDIYEKNNTTGLVDRKFEPKIITEHVKPNLPKCPTCQSTNIRKISGLSKAGNAFLWGIFAIGKISKQWHCDNCGSEW